jgi:hypothetical protein
LIVACDIHPLNNSGTLAYVRGPLQQQDHAVNAWYAHWMLTGLETIEAMIAPGPYAFGGQVTVADLCIVPQLANARRSNVPIQQFPRLLGAEAACQQREAFDGRARSVNRTLNNEAYPGWSRVFLVGCHGSLDWHRRERRHLRGPRGASDQDSSKPTPFRVRERTELLAADGSVPGSLPFWCKRKRTAALGSPRYFTDPMQGSPISILKQSVKPQGRLLRPALCTPLFKVRSPRASRSRAIAREQRC